MREELINFSFDVIWVPGKTHLIADALSRNPVFTAPEPEIEAIDINLDDPLVNELQRAAQTEDEYQSIITALSTNKVPKNLPPHHPARLYNNVWDSLSSEHNMLFLDNRIVIPQSMRAKIVDKLHMSHAGHTKTLQLARSMYYWPGMTNQIKQHIDSCPPCQTGRPSQQREPVIQTDADRPNEQFSADLFELQGAHYLAVADRYSGYPFAFKLNKLSTAHVTDILFRLFADYGFPTSIRTDGGPQFRSEFEDFCKDNNITHETSSPYNPRSNGHAENAVKMTKDLLRKCLSQKENFPLALLHFRNTPRADGKSPAQLFFGRAQRTTLPALDNIYNPINSKTVLRHRKLYKKQQKANADIHAKDLTALPKNTRVRIQNPTTKAWSQTGVIFSRKNERTYVVKIGQAFTTRNRFFLKPILPKIGENPDNDPDTEPPIRRVAEPTVPAQAKPPASLQEQPRRSNRSAPRPDYRDARPYNKK